MAKVLIGCAVRQKPRILAEFLKSLAGLDRNGLTADYFFVDNNDSQESSDLLKNFRLDNAVTFLGSRKPEDTYLCSEETHYWNPSLIWTVAELKNAILCFALQNGYSHIFLVDTDLVLHPLTLKQLLGTNKHIVSEVFWTRWTPDIDELPQVWLEGQYSFYRGGPLNVADKADQTTEFLNQLRVPGLYEVGGLGACTLISAEAVKMGVSYSKITNLDYWGEDRHFCIRAAVLGVRLFVDTVYPALHLYRESDLGRIAEYKEKFWLATRNDSAAATRQKYGPKSKGNRLTLSMTVRNEGGRYLSRVLRHTKQFIDAAVIIDDASEDNTVEVCRRELEGIPLTIVSRESSAFHTEHILRRQQWNETVKTLPDWIMVLDADEMFEDRIIGEIDTMLNQTDYDLYSFRLYDFWDKEHYREDEYWSAHSIFRPFIVRYLSGFNCIWQETDQHCGRLPINITELRTCLSPIRVKHFGWMNPHDRQLKYDRYMKLDPDGRYGSMKQYQSILDPQPNLVKWKELL